MPRAVLPLLIFTLLAACGRSPTPSPTCTIQGIDVSRHQGNIDWRKAADAGIKFAWIKATEGGDHLDPAFRRNWIMARTAGIKRGAYHFVYWCRKAEEQAAWFAATVSNDPDALPPVLDVEWNPGSRTCPDKVAREKGIADVKTMLDAMQRAYGKRPILYAPDDLYAEILAGTFEDYPLWARSLAGAPPTRYGARPWTIWQYSETGAVPGISGAVDRDCMEPGRLAALNP